MAQEEWRLEEAVTLLSKATLEKDDDQRNLVLRAVNHLMKWLKCPAVAGAAGEAADDEGEEDEFDPESEASRHG